MYTLYEIHQRDRKRYTKVSEYGDELSACIAMANHMADAVRDTDAPAWFANRVLREMLAEFDPHPKWFGRFEHRCGDTFVFMWRDAGLVDGYSPRCRKVESRFFIAEHYEDLPLSFKCGLIVAARECEKS